MGRSVCKVTVEEDQKLLYGMIGISNHGSALPAAAMMCREWPLLTVPKIKHQQIDTRHRQTIIILQLVTHTAHIDKPAVANNFPALLCWCFMA